MNLMRLFLSALIVATSACVTTYTIDKLNSDEQMYVAKVSKALPVFEVEKSKSEEAWSRGNAFINRFSGMRIQSSNEYHVSTYDPNDLESGTIASPMIGYNLIKEISGSKVKFTIHCLTKSMNFKYTAEVCRNNEKIMAHYMMSGELNEIFCAMAG